MKQFKIGNKLLNETSPVFIIAEIGVNHNGDFKTAVKTIDKALESGADCVKFQLFKAEEFMANNNHIYEYESRGKIIKESMYDMFKRLELSFEDCQKLFDYSYSKKILPLASAADIESVDFLIKINAPAIKIASEDLINVRLLKYISQTNMPIILSTGMADKKEIDIALNILKNNEKAILHCVSVYPSPDKELNLKKIRTLNQYNSIIGYSDHSENSLASICAVTLGAKIIEKHFTLDKTMEGPDHKFSANPQELKQLVKNIRNTEVLLGHPDLIPSKTELKTRNSFRRSIVASRNIDKGEIITENNISFKRPGKGLKPYEKDQIIGKKTKAPMLKDENITLENIEE